MLWFDFLASIDLLLQTRSPSMKTDKEEPKQENPKKENIHSVMKMKPIKKEGDKPSKKLIGKLSKKATLKSMNDEKVVKETEEHVT